MDALCALINCSDDPPRLPTLSEYPEFRPSLTSLLNITLFRTLDDLRNIKNIHTKITTKDADHQDDTSLFALQQAKSKIPYQPTPGMHKPPADVNRVSCGNASKAFCASVLAHVGFDSKFFIFFCFFFLFAKAINVNLYSYR
jgi:hypothetical protein